MPGICGVFDLNGATDVSLLLARMLRPLQRRDWYRTESRVEAQSGVGLGRVTLGFVNRGQQPAVVGSRMAVMDGEFYEPERLASQLRAEGWQADKDNHAELLLLGCERLGNTFWQDVHGSFSAAIWDIDRQQLTLVSDRFGTRPIYYAQTDGRFVFASRLASVMADDAISRTPNHTGIAQFFSFGHYLRDDTSMQDVRVLPSASLLNVTGDAGESQISHYGRAHQQSQNLNEEDWLERIDAAFVRAVERRVSGNGNLGLSLSGGMDARTILAVIDHSRHRVKTICMGVPGSLDHQSSQQLAELVGCQHHSHMLDGNFLANFRQHLHEMVDLTDGQYLSQCIVIPTLRVYQELGIQVLMRGHAGELMHMHKAYNYSLGPDGLAIRSNDQLEDWLYRHLRSFLLNGVDQPLFRGALHDQMTNIARESLRQDLRDVQSVDQPLQRIWHLFVKQRLRRETSLSMVKFRSVVEPRLPFLDNELIDVLLNAPVELKVGEKIQSFILRRHRPSFLRIANANTGAAVGASRSVQRMASLRMKVLGKLGVPGYQPYEKLGLWLRRELAPTVREILLSKQCLENGVFDADGTIRIVNNHLAKKRNHTYLLMAMMIYELGRRRLVEASETSDVGTPVHK